MKKYTHYTDCEGLISSAAAFVAGRRPAGGPYCVEIVDHPRYLIDSEARLVISISVDSDEDNGSLSFKGEVPLLYWRDLVKRN